MTFPPNTTANSLSERFGIENVGSREILIGEGEYEKGTVVFGDSSDQVEILWKDAEQKSVPRLISITGSSSQWKTRNGLSLGDALLSVENINRKPFRLLGFGWDYSGTLVSWSGGALETSTSTQCQVNVRFLPDQPALDSQWYRQVLGDREYSSDHPAMQALNPRIYEIWLEY